MKTMTMIQQHQDISKDCVCHVQGRLPANDMTSPCDPKRADFGLLTREHENGMPRLPYLGENIDFAYSSSLRFL